MFLASFILLCKENTYSNDFSAAGVIIFSAAVVDFSSVGGVNASAAGVNGSGEPFNSMSKGTFASLKKSGRTECSQLILVSMYYN